MRRNGRLLVILGVTLALAAVALAVFALTGGDKKDDTTTSDTTTTTPKDIVVVQAKRDIPAHTILKTEDVEEVKVSSDQVTPDSVQSVGEVVGFAYSVDLVQGQRLLRSAMEQPGLANELTAGNRAISLAVDKNNLLGGLLHDDDHVDVVYTISVALTRVLPTEPLELPEELTLRDIATTLPPYGESPGATYPYPGEEGSRFTISDVPDGDPQAKLVLQNVRVIRVVSGEATGTGGSQASSSDGSYVVLEVNSQQAEMLTFMENYGTFQLVLRGPDDADTTSTSGINLERMVTDYGFPYPKTVRVPGPGAQ
jgi:Flp pilus assembly protein CpaB